MEFGSHADVSIRGPLELRGATHASLSLPHGGAPHIRLHDVHFFGSRSESSSMVADIHNASAATLDLIRCDRSADMSGLTLHGTFSLR